MSDAVFSYHTSQDGKVFIAWHGRTVTTLKGAKAQHFLRRIERVDAAEAQLLMAKAAGNFKRGNEHRLRLTSRPSHAP